MMPFSESVMSWPVGLPDLSDPDNDFIKTLTYKPPQVIENVRGWGGAGGRLISNILFSLVKMDTYRFIPHSK